MNVRHLLNQTIHVARVASSTAWVEDGYGAPSPVPARVEWADAVEKDGEGEQATTRASIVTEAAIGPEDRVWLPGTTPGVVAQARTPGPEGCEPAVDLAGVTRYFVTKV